jgi:hypothetical protein
MIDSKAQKPPKPKIVVGPKGSPGKEPMMPNTVPSQDRIRERAYELYESRDREAGQEQQDWFCAEQEVLKREP